MCTSAILSDAFLNNYLTKWHVFGQPLHSKTSIKILLIISCLSHAGSCVPFNCRIL